MVFLASCSGGEKNIGTVKTGLIDGQLADCPDSPNCVGTQSTKSGTTLKAWPMKANLNETKAAIQKAVGDFGGATAEKDDRAYLHYTFKTRFGGFIDDVEFLIDEKTKEVHFRSASRVGYSDLGANKRRMQKLAASYK